MDKLYWVIGYLYNWYGYILVVCYFVLEYGVSFYGVFGIVYEWGFILESEW